MFISPGPQKVRNFTPPPPPPKKKIKRNKINNVCKAIRFSCKHHISSAQIITEILSNMSLARIKLCQWNENGQ